jgi:hypothetical protein
MSAMEKRSNGRAQAISAGIAVIGFAGCAIGWVSTPREFFLAYIFAEVFFVGLSLGSLAELMMHHLTGGYWGYGVRRFLEAAVGNLPLLALLFIPIFFGLSELYPWRHPEVIAANELLAKRQNYLTTSFFFARTVAAFLVWIVISQFLLKWSAEQDVTVSVAPTRKMRMLSAPGIVIYPFTMTFAAVDWIMSMEVEWYSTMFPVLICIGQMLGAIAFMIIMFARAAESTSLHKLAGRDNFHKIGNLLLAFVLMWAYLAFGQLLITWSGNLPAEISWYLHRIAGGWRFIVILLALFQFFLPFFLLLMKPIKKSRQSLTAVAGCVFIAHIVDVWWMIAPSLHPKGFYVSWITFAALIGVGGLWSAAFLWNLGKRRLIPLNDPRFALAVPV